MSIETKILNCTFMIANVGVLQLRLSTHKSYFTQPLHRSMFSTLSSKMELSRIFCDVQSQPIITAKLKSLKILCVQHFSGQFLSALKRKIRILRGICKTQFIYHFGCKQVAARLHWLFRWQNGSAHSNVDHHMCSICDVSK